MIAIRNIVTVMLVAIWASVPLAAADKPSSEERAASLAVLTKAMESITIASGADHTQLEFNKSPVLRYSDPVSTTSFAKISDGAVFVWTKNGYPEAVTAIHNSNTGMLWCELLSLSQNPLNASRMGQPQWYPKKSGVAFQPVKDAPIPDTGAPQRLTQMREMLRSFSASVADRDSARQELRLLSKPAFRYSQPDRGIVDGAIFVFARSTNPEMLLVLEARDIDGKRRWLFSPARFTGRQAEMRYKDQPIFTHEAFAGLRNPSEPFFQTFVPLGNAQ